MASRLVLGPGQLLGRLQDVVIDFWPFEYQVGLPFAPVLLGSLLIGFLVGCSLMWLRFGAARARARRAEQRAAVLERELVDLKRSGEAARRAAPQIPGTAGGPKAMSGRPVPGQSIPGPSVSGGR